MRKLRKKVRTSFAKNPADRLGVPADYPKINPTAMVSTPELILCQKLFKSKGKAILPGAVAVVQKIPPIVTVLILRCLSFSDSSQAALPSNEAFGITDVVTSF
tara:strand:+ start:1810 stop:2118 length:309 start_codon:yes stop_codon:yes gene_type:complete